MEIIKEYKKEREGNLCWIADYVCVIKMNNSLYTVVHTNSVRGSWTGNPITTESKRFEKEEEAMEYMAQIVEKI